MKKIIIVAILAIAAIPASAQSCCTFIYDCTKHYDSEGYYINTTCDSNLRGKTISFVWNPSTRSYEDVNIENTFCSFSTDDVTVYNGDHCYMGLQLPSSGAALNFSQPTSPSIIMKRMTRMTEPRSSFIKEYIDSSLNND